MEGWGSGVAKSLRTISNLPKIQINKTIERNLENKRQIETETGLYTWSLTGRERDRGLNTWSLMLTERDRGRDLYT